MERGLLGSVVKPLLAPLNAIPGFVTISDLLFGDDNVIKKVTSLVLHAEPASSGRSLATNSTGEDTDDEEDEAGSYKYSLMASTDERTQVYLVPLETGSPQMTTNSSSTNGTSAASFAASGDNHQNATMVVSIVVPLLNSTSGEPMTWCATFDMTPPSPLELQPCRNGSDPDVDQSKSQRFQYDASSGALSPLYRKEWAGNLSGIDTPADGSDNGSTNRTATMDDSSLDNGNGNATSTSDNSTSPAQKNYRVLAAVDDDSAEADDAEDTLDSSEPASGDQDAGSSSSSSPSSSSSSSSSPPQQTQQPSNVSLRFVPAGNANSFAAKPSSATVAPTPTDARSSTDDGASASEATPSSTDDAASMASSSSSTSDAPAPTETGDHPEDCPCKRKRSLA